MCSKGIKSLFFALVLLVPILTSGCGYTFQGSGSVLPADVRRIYIPPAQNNTAEPGLSNIITEALRDRFERYGVVYVVDNQIEADAILEARIEQLDRETRTSTSTTDTDFQLDSVLTLGAELRRKSGPLLWANPALRVSRGFGAAGSAVVTSSADFSSGTLSSGSLGSLSTREVSRGQEREVLEQLAEEAARQIYDEAVAPDF